MIEGFIAAVATVVGAGAVGGVLAWWLDWGSDKPNRPGASGGLGEPGERRGWSGPGTSDASDAPDTSGTSDMVVGCGVLLAVPLVELALFVPAWRTALIWVTAALPALLAAACPGLRLVRKQSRGLLFAADLLIAAALSAGCGAAALLLTDRPDAGRWLLAGCGAGLCAAATLIVLRAPLGTGTWHAAPSAARWTPVRLPCAVACLLLAAGAVGLLAPGRTPQTGTLAVELLIAAPAVVLAYATVAVPRAAARRGRSALAGAACCVAGLLLLAGLGAVLAGRSSAVAGAVLMFAAAGPLMLLICLALLGRGRLLPWRAIPARQRAAVLLATVAAPLALVGAVGWGESRSAGYAMAYGRPVQLGLPHTCTVAGSGGAATCNGSWFRAGSAYETSVAEQDGTVHLSDRAWSRYSSYYSIVGGFVTDDDHDPDSVTLHARVVGDDAYVTLGYSPGTLASLGRSPVPSLTPVGLVALLAPVWLGFNAAARKRAGDPWGTVRPGAAAYGPADHPGTGVPGSPGTGRVRPAAPRRSGPATLVSRHVRVTADRTGFTVEQDRGTARTRHWRTHLHLPWPQLRRLEFSDDTRDPVVALFAYPADGPRRYALDASHLTRAQWHELADAVAAMSGSRVRLDLGGLDGRWVNAEA